MPANQTPELSVLRPALGLLGRARANFVYLAAFLMDFTFSSGSLACVYYAKERFSATPANLGLLALLSAGTYVLSSLFFGRLSDWWGRRPNIFLACGLNVFAFLMVPFAGQLWHLYFLIVPYAAGQGAFWPAVVADISDHSTPRELPHRLGRFNVFWCLGFSAGSFGGGALGQHFGQPTALRLAATLAGAALLVHLLRTFGPVRAAGDEPHPAIDQAARRPQLFWLMALLFNFSAMGLAATLRYHMPNVTGIGRSGLGGLYVALFFLAQLVTYAVLSRWRGWYYRLGPMVVGWGLAAGGAAVCGLSGGSLAFGVGCALAGVGGGVGYFSSIYYSVSAKSGRGRRSGIHESVLAAGAAVVPYAGGLLAHVGAVRGLTGWPQGIPHLTAAAVLLLAGLSAVSVFLAITRSDGSTPPQP